MRYAYCKLPLVNWSATDLLLGFAVMSSEKTDGTPANTRAPTTARARLFAMLVGVVEGGFISRVASRVVGVLHVWRHSVAIQRWLANREKSCILDADYGGE